MSTDFLEKIKNNEKKRQEIIADLARVKKMVKGSFCQIYVKCGKKNCWCATGKGHSHWRMSLKENGKSFSRAVPREEYAWIKEMTANYREFKNLRKKMLELEIQIKNLWDSYEISCINESKKGKGYLDISEVIDNKTSGSSKKTDKST